MSASPAQFEDVGAVDVGDDRLDRRPRELIRRSLRAAASALGRLRGDVVFVEEHLPLEIVRLDEVAVDEAQMADAGADQRVGQHGAQRTAADEGDAAVQQPPLAFFADAAESHLPAVAFGDVRHDLASRHRGNDADFVAVFHGGIQVVQVTNILVVDEDVDEPLERGALEQFTSKVGMVRRTCASASAHCC